MIILGNTHAFRFHHSFPFIRNLFKFYRILLKFFILINCLNLTRSQFNPMENGLCSDYLVEDLVSSSVSTFKQLWVTSERVAVFDRRKLTFITYLDNWLRSDGSPNVREVLQELTCSDFGRSRAICNYELEYLRIKHSIFDGIYTYIFLLNVNNRNWRVIVIEMETAKLITLDFLDRCGKQKKRQPKFYEQFYCIINHNFDLNSIASLLIMNIDLSTRLDQSGFELWTFFKNRTMKKLRFNDRTGNYQLINLSLKSNVDISLASIQFIPNEFLTFNSSFNPLNNRERRSTELNLIDSKSVKRKRETDENFKPKKHKKRRKHHHKKNYLRTSDSPLTRKSFDLHLNRLVGSLNEYLKSFNLTLANVLEKMKSIKNAAINTLFPYKQNEVIIFHKYYATFHPIESNFIIQPNRLPFIQPNQVYLGCPQPFCFLSTFDDITYNRLTKEIFIFRNQYFWTIGVDQMIRDPKQPFIRINYPHYSNAKLIGEPYFPKDFPQYIDAATFISFENFNYLIAIKDAWVYVYIPQNRNLVPLLLSDYLDKRMPLNRIDTVLFYGKQLFVFSGSNYWLYDLVDDLKLKFNSQGFAMKNIPINLDAAFTFHNRFYFFKQNFFYLNDARGNSLISPQMIQASFLAGCDSSLLPRDVKMNQLFTSFELINMYCMRCSGYIVDRLKDKWNVNNRTFVTVEPDKLEDRDGDIDLIEINTEKNNLQLTTKLSTNINSGSILPPSLLPGVLSGSKENANENDRLLPPKKPAFKVVEKSNEKTTTESNIEDGTENDKSNRPGFRNALNRVDEFALNSWTFFTHHLLFGFGLLIGILFIIYFCKRNKEKFRSNHEDEDQLNRKGKMRRKEMRRRNRRWD